MGRHIIGMVSMSRTGFLFNIHYPTDETTTSNEPLRTIQYLFNPNKNLLSEDYNKYLFKVNETSTSHENNCRSKSDLQV